MVVVPIVSLSTVQDAEPAALRLDAGTSRAASAAAAERLPDLPARASRSRAMTIAFEKANEGPTTTASPSTTAPPAKPPATKLVSATVAKPVPTTVKPTTTTAKPKPTTTTTAKPKPTTTTTAKPTPTTTAAPPPPTNREEGAASFHDYPDDRMCAHRTLPFGTVLRVTNLDNGKQTTCRVGDRGPFVAGRIIDLSRVAFGQIGSVSQGVIRVSIEW
jgi:rare lipoprotein A